MKRKYTDITMTFVRRTCRLRGTVKSVGNGNSCPLTLCTSNTRSDFVCEKKKKNIKNRFTIGARRIDDKTNTVKYHPQNIGVETYPDDHLVGTFFI